MFLVIPIATIWLVIGVQSKAWSGAGAKYGFFITLAILIIASALEYFLYECVKLVKERKFAVEYWMGEPTGRFLEEGWQLVRPWATLKELPAGLRSMNFNWDLATATAGAEARLKGQYGYVLDPRKFFRQFTSNLNEGESYAIDWIQSRISAVIGAKLIEQVVPAASGGPVNLKILAEEIMSDGLIAELLAIGFVTKKFTIAEVDFADDSYKKASRDARQTELRIDQAKHAGTQRATEVTEFCLSMGIKKPTNATELKEIMSLMNLQDAARGGASLDVVLQQLADKR